MTPSRLAFLCGALLVAAPAGAQTLTVPIHSLWQPWTADFSVTTSVSLYGYTSKSAMPRVLRKQTVRLGTATLLQPEFRAEFAGLSDAEMTVMQLIVKSTADTPTFHADVETIAPKKPLSVKVPAGKKLWVVYRAPAGAQGELRFYVGTPPPERVTSAPTTSGAAMSSLDEWEARPTYTLVYAVAEPRQSHPLSDDPTLYP
jgi:hypothetical protein